MEFLNDLISKYHQSSAEDLQAAMREHIAEAVDGDTVDIGELTQAAVDEFNSHFSGGQYDPASVPTMQAISTITQAARAEKSDRDQAARELDEQVQALAESMAEPDSGDDEHQDEPDDSGSDADEATQTRGETGNTGDDTPTPAESAPAGDTAGQSQQSEPVAAAAGPRKRVPSGPRTLPTSREMNQHRPDQKIPDGSTGGDSVRRVSITAAADVPDRASGEQMSMRGLAESTLARFRSMPVGQPGVGEMRKSVGVINKGYPDSLTASGTPGNHTDVDLIDRVSDERQLPGGSLVAAAQQAENQAANVTAAMNPLPTPPGDVWCAPSQRDFSLCEPLAQRTGMLDLPSMSMPSMGGIQWPTWWQFPDMHRPPESNPPDDPNNPGRNSWHGFVHQYDPDLKNPNYFVENPKKCIEGPCPDWQEERMHLAYLCVQGDILREYVWPSIAERFISDVLTSHAHYMNEIYIQYIMGHSDNLPAFSANDTPEAGQVEGYGIGSAAEAVIERLGYIATWFRSTYRMSFSETLEGFAPFWLREYLKVDLERKSNRPHGSVSNSEVTALFAQWNMRVQWVYDHPQSLDVGNEWNGSYSGGVMPGASNAVWPNSATLTMYPAGSWVLAEDNIVRLDALYDSEKLKNNKYTALFTEDAWLLMNKCNRSFNIPLVDLCLNGAVGPNRDACPVSLPVHQTEPVPAAAAQTQAASKTGGSGAKSSGSSSE